MNEAFRVEYEEREREGEGEEGQKHRPVPERQADLLPTRSLSNRIYDRGKNYGTPLSGVGTVFASGGRPCSRVSLTRSMMRHRVLPPSSSRFPAIRRVPRPHPSLIDDTGDDGGLENYSSDRSKFQLSSYREWIERKEDTKDADITGVY